MSYLLQKIIITMKKKKKRILFAKTLLSALRMNELINTILPIAFNIILTL